MNKTIATIVNALRSAWGTPTLSCRCTNRMEELCPIAQCGRAAEPYPMLTKMTF